MTNPEKKTDLLALLLLFWAVLLMIVISLWPFFLLNPQTNKSDHTAASLLMWSMSAAFVRGCGFKPRHWLPRWLLGTPAAVITAVAALLRLFLLSQ